MIGLFAISAAIGPLILMIVFTVFTALFHISLNSALDPLLYNLPKTLDTEEESVRALLSGESNGEDKATTTVAVAEPPTKKPNFVAKFFKPHIYSDYHTLRKLIPHNLVDVDNLYDENVQKNAYFPPSVTSETPLLWVPKDDYGISRQEILHTSKVIPITDDGCTFDENNALVWDQETSRPPLWSEKIYY